MKGCAALLLYWRPGQTAGAWYGSWRKGMEELLLKLVTAGLLAVIGWIDGRTMEIPYALSGALAICALADFFLFPGLPVGERLMGMVCVSVPMYTLCMVVKEAFGGLESSANGFFPSFISCGLYRYRCQYPASTACFMLAMLFPMPSLIP